MARLKVDNCKIVELPEHLGKVLELEYPNNIHN